MRLFTGPAALAALFALSAAAFAATMTTGVVKSYDAQSRQLTLQDGSVYSVDSKAKIPSLSPGEKVSINWVMNGKMHDATGVTLVK